MRKRIVIPHATLVYHKESIRYVCDTDGERDRSIIERRYKLTPRERSEFEQADE
jgi:hypothetical protein